MPQQNQAFWPATITTNHCEILEGLILKCSSCVCLILFSGHNADDVAETVLMNVLRGDIARLRRCTAISTASEGEGVVPRCKPLKYAYEKEIVLYAYFKKLDYFSTECIYSPNAYRGHTRTFLKDLETLRPSAIMTSSTLGRTCQ